MAEALARKSEFLTLVDYSRSKDELSVEEESPTDYVWQGFDLPPDLTSAEEGAKQPIESKTHVISEREEQVETETLSIRNLRERLVQSIIPITRTHRENGQFTLLQKWEGVITQIGEDSIMARLTDLSNVGPDEEVELSIEEVPGPDRDLLAVGAIFYWYIGYLDTASKQRIRASIIRFRRLPVWTAKELDKAEAEAQSLRELLVEQSQKRASR